MDGSGAETTILSDAGGKYPIGYSPDGRFLLYMNVTGATRGRLWLLSLADRKTRELFPSQNDMHMSAEISPDGRWIAYVFLNEQARSSLYIASFPDGRELFFTTPGRFMAVDVDTSGAAPETGAPRVLFEVSVAAPALGLRSTYAVAPDGQRFLFKSWGGGTSSAPVTLVVNWPQALRQ